MLKAGLKLLIFSALIINLKSIQFANVSNLSRIFIKSTKVNPKIDASRSLNDLTKTNSTNSINSNRISEEMSYINPNFNCVNDVNFDFLIYSIAWQTKSCQFATCKDLNSNLPKFSIQSLRTNLKNGKQIIQCCNDKQLNISNLNSILPKLKQNRVYETKLNFSNESLKEKWDRYSSCVTKNLDSIQQIFEKTLDLAKKLPIQKLLKEMKIEPSNNRTYDFQVFNQSISTKLKNKTVLIRCRTYDEIKQLSLIETIDICFDKESYEIINCPSEFATNCLKNVYLTETRFSDREEIYTKRDVDYNQFLDHQSYISLKNTSNYLEYAFFKPLAYFELKDLHSLGPSWLILRDDRHVKKRSLEIIKSPSYNSSTYSGLFTLMYVSDDLAQNGPTYNVPICGIFTNFWRNFLYGGRSNRNNRNNRNNNGGNNRNSGNLRSSSTTRTTTRRPSG